MFDTRICLADHCVDVVRDFDVGGAGTGALPVLGAQRLDGPQRDGVQRVQNAVEGVQGRSDGREGDWVHAVVQVGVSLPRLLGPVAEVLAELSAINISEMIHGTRFTIDK